MTVGEAPDFIFMLTHADRTIPDARDRVNDALAAGVRHIGFKDVGLPQAELREVARAIRHGGATVYLEVVSLDEESERASARAAVTLGVDVLMGGTRPSAVLPIIAGLPIRYYPFAGRITGHPSVLEGSIEQIVENARDIAARNGVDGLDLLAYRFQGDAAGLIERVCAAAAPKPVVVAGSIDRPERIAAATRGGARGFTVGTAALDGSFPTRRDLRSQLSWILSATADEKGKSMEKVNLSEAFARFSDHWSPKIVGDVNNAQVKLAKFQGAFHWHHHDLEDELFFVVAGRLRMGFRERDVDLDPGEFIIVPRGVEHRPEALDGECHVMLLEPNTTLNTGNIINERTVETLDRIAG